MENGNVLRGRSPQSVESQIGKTSNWKIETLGKGAHKGQGWVFREYGTNGQATGRVIRWHPGGGQHGPGSYWTVSNGVTKVGQIK